MARDVVSELARLAQELKQIKRGQRYAHGGSLDLAARDGGGLMVTVRLPRTERTSA